MQKNYYILFTIFIIGSLAFSQDTKRIEVFGKIIVDSVDVEGVTIYNTSSNKGTITDIEGQFSIEVTLNDRVEVSALQFEKFVIVINEAIMSSKIMTVFLVERINKLDEVIKILPEGKKPTIAELTDPNWADLTVILEEKLVREIIPDLKVIGVEDIVEYPINKIIH